MIGFYRKICVCKDYLILLLKALKVPEQTYSRTLNKQKEKTVKSKVGFLISSSWISRVEEHDKVIKLDSFYEGLSEND